MRRAVILTVLGVAACGRSAPPAAAGAEAEVPKVPPQLRRLSNQELSTVTGDLLGHPVDLTAGLMREPRVEGFDDATTLLVTEAKLDDFVATAELVAAEVSTPGCSAEACALDFAAGFAAQAWGRAPTADERERLGAVYRAGAGHAEGLKLLVEAMLLSPHFVYRAELGAPSAGGHVRLTQDETASALSFLLTGGRPDAELRRAAADGLLEIPAQREKQARRLLATERGRLRVRDLLKSWLDVHALEQVNRQAALTYFTYPLRHGLQAELDRYLDDAAFGPVGTMEGLFASQVAFPSKDTAAIYGDDLLDPIGDLTAARMKPDRRRGVLSLGGFLAHHAAHEHSAPVQRGLFIRSRLLCDEIAPPPPGVLNAPPNPNDGSATTRKKYAAHSEKPACAGCHTLMDPIGFGLEAFDATGRFRTTDNGFPVDARGQLKGTDVDGDFVGPHELSLMLSRSGQVRRCFAQALWRGAMGRAVELPKAIQPAADAKIVDLLLDVVTSDGFVRRSGEATP